METIRLQIGSDSRGRVTVESSEAKKKRERNPAKLVTAGSVAVQIFGRGPYTIAWRESAKGPRRRVMRSAWKNAKRFAEKIADDLANGQVAMNQFTESDRASYKRALEILQPIGQDLELATATYAEAIKKLNGVPLQQVIDFWKENCPRGIVPHPLPQLVELYLAGKKTEISDDYFTHIEHQLRSLANAHPGNLHALQAPEINQWLGGLKVGHRAKHNYRAAVDQFIRWSKAMGYLQKNWDELVHVPDPGTKVGEIKILTPEKMTELLAARLHAEEEGKAEKTLIPFLACQAFAGLRHKEAWLLDWSDIHLDEAYIYVSKKIAKTGHDRVVPIAKSLAAWLFPYAKRNGRITSIERTSNALVTAKRQAGIPAGENETRNSLRKSFISYRLAVTKNVAQVAEEAGNSAAMIRKHYGRPLPQAEGKRWFDIWPTAADVVQFNFAGI